jgi:hypothetical protein
MRSAVPTKGREFEFLCSVVRPRLQFDRAFALLDDGLDFPTLLDLAAQHGVRPLLIGALAQLEWRNVPDDARAGLDAFRHRHLLRCLAVAAELCGIAETFDRDGISFATFKGVALAAALYGDPAAREYNDIDIIVPPDRVHDAERALAGRGYRSDQGDEAFRRAFLSYQGQYALKRADGDFAVDLHWAFSGAYLPFPLAAEELWRAQATVTIAGRAVPTLAGAELALLLAGHGTKERWQCLEWVNDFARLVEGLPDLDWSGVHERARRRRCGNAVLLGCTLASELLGVSVPAALAADVERSDVVLRRARGLIDRLRQGTRAWNATNFTDIELCDRPIDRLRAMVGLICTPTAGDYHAMPLPANLWGAYRATRPFRLAAKAAGFLFRERQA